MFGRATGEDIEMHHDNNPHFTSLHFKETILTRDYKIRTHLIVTAGESGAEHKVKGGLLLEMKAGVAAYQSTGK